MPTDIFNPNLDKKVIFWNRLYRGSLLVLLITITVLAAVGVNKVFVISNKLEKTTTDIRQTQTKAQTTKYIKCLVLAKFDVPAEQLETREGVEKALDNCAN